MSTTVDNRVVEMRFDNKHFENNVQTSLSTIEKLKQSLNFSGVSKGFDNLNSASRRFDISPISAGIETVRAKFSALEVMGVTALANITNSVVNAGKRMTSALTIEPIKDGFGEYELTLNAIQTTMAGTGKTAKEVEDELKKLDEYADKTVYSTADMLNNLPKFTNAGVELEKATTAMIGIANATALAGGDAGKASIAFYNLGQAIGTGYLTRMDYNSINNAGIATMEWKEQMVGAAISAGTLKKAGDDLYEAGGKTFTMQQLFIDGLQEQWATTDVMMKVFGDYGDETTVIGEKAYSAAQDIKTFSQMMESLKATAGTGWKDTWQIIFGDLDEAKALWTGLSEFISGIITKMADFRNGLLESALGKSITGLSDNLKTVGKVAEPIKEATDAIKDLGDIVDKVIVGDFGNGAERIKALTDAGYDYATIQNKVNEKLGSTFRHTEKVTDAQEENAEVTKDQADATIELDEKEKDRLKGLLKMSEAELRSKGYTDDQIEALRELGEQAKNLGVPIDDFIDNLDNLNGRFLLINGFKNIGRALCKVFQALGDAWKAAFNPPTLDEQADGLFNIITAFSRFTSKLVLSDEDVVKLTRTFEGLFAALDLILTITGGGLRVAFELFKAVLEVLDIDILDITSAIADAIIGFRDWVDETLDFTGAIEKIAPIIAGAVTAVRDWVNENVDLAAAFDTIVSTVKGAIDGFHDWIDSLKDSENLPKDIADGIINGLGKAFDFIVDMAKELGKKLTGEFGLIPGDCIAGFANGIWEGLKVAGEVMLELGKAILEKIKEVLGIHSPSTEFFQLAWDCITGFINGTLEAIKTLIPLIYDIGKGILGSFAEGLQNGQIDFGTIFAGVLSGGLILGFVKIADGVQNIGKAFEGLGDVFEGAGKVLNSFSGVLKSVSFGIKAEAIKSIAMAIAILAGSLVVLSLVNPTRLAIAGGAIIALMLTMMGLIAVLGHSSKSMGDSLEQTFDVAKITVLVLGVAGAMLLMANAAKIMGDLKPDAFTQGLAAVAAFAGIVTILTYVTKSAGPMAGQIGTTMLAISGAMILMAYAVKMMGDINDAAIGKGMIAITGFFGIIVLLIVISKVAGPMIGQMGTTMLAIAGAIALMGLAVKMLGSLDSAVLENGIHAVCMFVDMLLVLVAVLGFISIISGLAGGQGSVSGIGTALLGIAGAIAILAIVAVLLSRVDADALAVGITAVERLAGIAAILAIVVSIFGKDAPKMAATLMALSIAIGVLAGIAVILSFMDETALAKGIGAVTALAAIIGVLVLCTSIAQNCVGTIVAITVAITVLVTAVVVLSTLNPDAMWPAVGAVTALVGMLAILVASTALAKGSMGVLIVVTVAIGLLGGILYLLSQLPIESVISSAIALGGLMLVLTGVIAALSLLGIKSLAALAGVVALLALCVPLAALVGILYLMEGLQNARTNVEALSIFAGALTLMLLPLTLVGVLVAPALAGVVAMLALCVPLVALVGILYLMEGLQNAEANVKLLTSLLTTMTVVLTVLAIIGPLALVGVTAMAALTALIAAVGVMAVGIGALMETFPQLKEFLDTGIPILEQLAYAIGSMVGNVIAGVVDTVANCALPELGTMLSDFMINATPFIDGVKMVDDKVLNGVGILTAAVLALTAADLVTGIGSFLSGGSSFATLGTELSQFITNAKPFIDGVKNIDPVVAEGATAMANMILALTGANLLEQLTSWITGESSLSAFAEELVPFGKAMAEFSNEVKNIDPETVSAAANAGKVLAEMASALPNTGGILGTIMGDNDMDTFGIQLKSFGKAIASFSNEVKDVSPESVEAAANAGKVMAEMAKAIPNTGGILSTIMGDNDMAAFGIQLKSFGKAIASFSNEVKDIDEDSITAAANAGKVLTEMANTIPNSGGLIGAIMGENDMGTFGTQIKSFGKAIASFSKEVKGIDEDAVNAAANAGTIMSKLASNLPEDGGFLDIFTGGTTSLEDFGTQLASFGSSIKSFAAETSGISADKLTSVVGQTEKLVKMLSNMEGVDFTGASSFKSALSELGKASVDDFVKAFTNSASKVENAGAQMVSNFEEGARTRTTTMLTLFRTFIDNMISAIEKKYSKFESCGSKLVTEIGNGIADNTSKVTKKLKNVLTNMVDTVEGEYYDFKSAGRYLVEGFANGISANTFKAEAKAAAMARAALRAAEDALDVNSPSKESYRVGDFFGQGFINAISNYTSSAYSSGYEMADRAKVGLSNAISKVKDFINTDIDAQPTIRPVLDLSDVESGVGAIDGMLGLRPSVGVLGRVNSIGPMMSRVQNGVNNDDVVMAIRELGDKIDGSSGDSYNVNGITYDDGSNISNAVKTLVRAARQERRI